ncbi:hypothetical protein Rsub_08305 [Raphidocelis subcapitata]|uniref:Uncharacterized protein n=1 Tax=Raphidocelis subcapitata TaxID=307507 RepID=A0A2V0P5X3_9CHLO|nr:hypothetical protein Rsub_08305 [Raphidocelis subcapitata]|eukprot:GBF95274.1 hypothetical protein Rsub_08305 [Raphidocelis subcapitata]
MAAGSGGLKLVDFGNSLFWTLAGVISVGCTVTAVNQRVRAQEEHLELLRRRNAVMGELVRAQDDAEAVRGKLRALEAELDAASGWRWGPAAGRLARTLAAGPGSCSGPQTALSSGGGGGGGGGTSSRSSSSNSSRGGGSPS